MAKVFLCHSSKDKAFARKLASMLQENGIQVWIDEAELKIGDSLLHKIGSALDEADFIAAVLSHNSVSSTWVQKELVLAMQKELTEKRVTVLPILKEPCDIPNYLKDKLYADFTDPNSFDAPFFKLLHALGIEKTTSPVPEKKIGLHEPVQEKGSELEGFQDIVIKEVDKNMTYKPDKEETLYNVYFELTDYPPQEWVELFDAERQFPRHTMWRKAWVEGKYIVVYCVPEEVKQYHLRDIKQDVGNCNDKYRQFLQREAIQRARQQQREQEDKKALDSALDNLDILEF